MTNLRTTACVSLFLLTAGGAWLSAPAAAQEQELPKLSTEQIIERLDTSRGGPPPEIRTRGLRPGGDAEAERPSAGPAATQPTPAAAAQTGSAVASTQEGAGSGRVDMQIQFGYDSAELTPEARADLDRLGAALASDRLEGFAFKVAGHTDAAGPEDYNMQLSKRRAQSVVDYLSSRYGIEPSRLQSEGWGETSLYDASNPRAGINRRVEIINVGQATAAR